MTTAAVKVEIEMEAEELVRVQIKVYGEEQVETRGSGFSEWWSMVG